jgi:hypothetical protein
VRSLDAFKLDLTRTKVHARPPCWMPVAGTWMPPRSTPVKQCIACSTQTSTLMTSERLRPVNRSGWPARYPRGDGLMLDV